MKSFIPYSLIAAALACGFASAQTPTTAYTTPVGYTSVTIDKNADTRVGLPFRQPTVAAAALTETPTANVLTVAGAAFGTYGGTHYVKFTSGLSNGKIYAITTNDATTITIDLNGDTLAAVSTDTFSVSKFWTLKELFDPALSTSDPLTTGNAIVASTGTTVPARRTTLMTPQNGGVGSNLVSQWTYYIAPIAPTLPVPGPLAPHWVRTTSNSTNYDDQQLWPDLSFIIRHPASVTSSTVYVNTGEVDMGTSIITLETKVGATSDNAVALTRPVDVTLSQLNLGGTSAFVSSAGTTVPVRRDLLMVYFGGTPSQNKVSTATYYYDGNASMWRKTTSSTYNANSDVIPAGVGFMIRKYAGTGATSFWTNTPSY